MDDSIKALKITRYYAVAAILLCIFFVMRANEYFPPLSAVAEPTLRYLQEQQAASADTAEQEKIAHLILQQKMAMRHDAHVDEVKISIMILSSLFLFLSVAVYLFATRALTKLSGRSWQGEPMRHTLLKPDVRTASRVMIAVLSLAVLFHLSVMAGMVPYGIVWGGRLENRSQMYLHEAVSLTVNLFVIAVAAMRGGFMKALLPQKAVTGALWLLVVLFSLNTVGNLLAQTWLETAVFTPLTALLALLSYRMAIERPGDRVQVI